MAFPVVLNGRTYTLADFEGTNYVDGLPDAFEDFVTHAGDIYNDTSTSSAAIGTGSKTFTVSSGKPYQAGTPLRIADAAAPSTNFLDAVVTSYSGTTLVVDVFGFAGSGTKTSWTINIGGAKTADGTLGISQGGTGATTAAAARTALDTYSKSEADSRFLNVSGEASDVTMTGNVTIGDAGTDTLTINAATTTTADVSFGDNNKAIFGAGSDLQIYHDGSNSIVKDGGSGDLFLIGSDDIKLQSAAGENYARFNENGKVTLYHNNVSVFTTESTGIDVTGEVKGDSLEIGSNTDGASVEVTSAVTDFTIGGLSTGSDLLFSYNRGSGDTTIANGARGSEITRAKIANGGDISFYENTGTTQAFYWDASTSRLGLGTTNPSYQLSVEGSSAAISIDNTAGSPDQTLMVLQADMGTNDRNFQIKSPSTDSASAPFRFTTGNSFAFEIDTTTDALVIDSAANVGIGTQSPSAVSGGVALEAESSTGAEIIAGSSLASTVGGEFIGAFLFKNNDNSATYPHYAGMVGKATNQFGFIDLEFYAGRDAYETGGNPHLFISGSNTTLGYVGIGAQSPTRRLDVEDSVGTVANFESTGTSGGGFSLADANTTANAVRIRGIGNAMQFVTNNSEAMRIDSSGHAIIPAGVTLGTSAGTYAAANTLDDYEEGTWTPTLEGYTTAGSYSISAVNCRYTKIGRQVTVEGELTITVSSAGTGLAKFGGLPFACDGTPVPVGNVRVSGIALPSSTLYAVASFFTSNSSDFSVSGVKDSTAPQTLDIGGISTSDVLRISMTYITAS